MSASAMFGLSIMWAILSKDSTTPLGAGNFCSALWKYGKNLYEMCFPTKSLIPRAIYAMSSKRQPGKLAMAELTLDVPDALMQWLQPFQDCRPALLTLLAEAISSQAEGASLSEAHGYEQLEHLMILLKAKAYALASRP